MVLPFIINEDHFKFSYGNYHIFMSKLHYCAFDCFNMRNGIHAHDYYEICYVLDGSGEFYSNNVCYPIDRHTVFTNVPRVNHEIVLKGDRPLQLYFFTFTVSKHSAVKEPSKQDRIIENFLNSHYLTADRCAHIRSYFQILTDYISHNGSYGVSEICSAMLMDFLLSLTSSQNTISENTNNLIANEIAALVCKNIQSRIAVKDLCSKLNMSQRSLFYYFKNHMNTTPIHFINSVKMSTAIEYFKMGFSAKNVALSFGFTDLSSFSRMFKKYYGISPREFIKKYINN